MSLDGLLGKICPEPAFPGEKGSPQVAQGAFFVAGLGSDAAQASCFARMEELWRRFGTDLLNRVLLTRRHSSVHVVRLPFEPEEFALKGVFSPETS